MVEDRIPPPKMEPGGTKLDRIIDDHWDYVAGVINAVECANISIETIEYHYKTAFEHGYKHGVESGPRRMTDKELHSLVMKREKEVPT